MHERDLMGKLLAAEWLRLSRWRINHAAILLLILAVGWHFWDDCRRARSNNLLADHGVDLLYFRALPAEDLEVLPDAEKWRWFAAQKVSVTLPDTFRVAFWIWPRAQALSLLLIILTVGNEFQWSTARWLLSLGPGRGRWLLTKVVAWLLVALVATAFLWLVVASAGICIHWRLLGNLTWTWATADFWGQQAAAMLRAWIGFWPWIGLGVLLAMMSRSPVVAATFGAMLMVLDLLWGYALRMLAAMSTYSGQANLPHWLMLEGLLGQAYRWTIGYNVAAVLYWAGDRVALAKVVGQYGEPSLAAAALYIIPTLPERALVVVLGYMLLAAGLAAWLLIRRDVTR